MTKKPDTYYINALKNGNKQGLSEIYQVFRPGVIQLVTGNSGSINDAEDIFQEGIVALYQMVKTSYPINNFGGLLRQICRNKWLKTLRSRKKMGFVDTADEDMEYTDEKDMEAAIMLQERLSLFWKHFKQLDEKCRELLKYQFDGKSHKEIAELMNYTYDFARKKKSRCKQKMLKSIQNDPLYKELGN